MRTGGSRPALPTGTVTFLRTDIEGSMRLVRELGDRYDALQSTHHALIRAAYAPHGGVEVGTEGDAFFLVFEGAGDAVRSAVAMQRALAAHDWPDGVAPRVRVGIHTGSARLAGDDYGGFDVNRVARIANTGSGGQIVLSDTVRALVVDDLPEGTALRDLGRHRLKDIATPEHLFQLDVDGLPTDFPPLRGTLGSIGNLPARVTTFVGRAMELERLQDLLASNRLITLTGPGGAGKTSLALELARQVGEGYPDGCWLIDLSPLRDPSLVKAAIARTLGLYDGVLGSAADRLEGHLAERTTLLLLDNFEQVLEAASTVSDLLRAAPRVGIVVASRAPLRIAGEQEFPVGPLAGGEGDGRRLFLERARAVRPDLRVGPSDDAAVAEICRLLDGLPLGIELAAARVGTLPIAAIRDRLAAKLPLPGSGPRDLPTRQRTLDDAIAWSYDLLEAPVRPLFDRVGVFAGSFDLAQAEEVCGPADELGIDVLDGLVRLAEQSLLYRDDGAGDTGIRFRALETVRTFALARLRAAGELDAIRDRHAASYLALAERAAPHLPGGTQAAWIDRLAADDPNLRAAILRTVERRDATAALSGVAHLWRYWLLSGRLNDGKGLIATVFAMPGAEVPSAARVRALDAAGGTAYWQGEASLAEAIYAEQAQQATALGLAWEEANGTYNLAHARFALGDEEASTRAIDVAKAKFVALGDRWMVGRIEWAETTSLQRLGRGEEARERFLDLLGRFHESGDIWYEGLAFGSLAWVDVTLGRFDSAFWWAVQSLRVARDLGDVADMTLSIQMGAVAGVVFQRPTETATLLGAFDELCQVNGIRPPAGLRMLMQSMGDPHAYALAALGPVAYEEARARGTAMTLDEAVEAVFAFARELGVQPPLDAPPDAPAI
jgi:predicted ATPase/class 3 adenylate cyclase